MSIGSTWMPRMKLRNTFSYQAVVWRWMYIATSIVFYSLKINQRAADHRGQPVRRAARVPAGFFFSAT